MSRNLKMYKMLTLNSGKLKDWPLGCLKAVFRKKSQFSRKSTTFTQTVLLVIYKWPKKRQKLWLNTNL